jgi:hypothetical protein
MKKMLKIFLTFSMILSTKSNAESTVFIEKDTPAPFSGYLFTEQAGKELKLKLVDLEYFKQLSTSLQNQVDLYVKIDLKTQEKLNVLSTQNDKLAQTAYNASSLNAWEKGGYFLLGVAAAILAAFAVKQVVR